MSAEICNGYRESGRPTPYSLLPTVAEAGNVLLLSLFVLSTILIGATALSAIVLRDLKIARTLDEGGEAYYAAETGIEGALYDLRKTDLTPSGIPGAGALSSGASFIRQVIPGEPVYTVPLLKKDDFTEFNLLDPDNLQNSPGIEALRFNWTDTCGGLSGAELSYAEWPVGASFVWPTGGSYTGTFWKFRHQSSEGLPWLKADTIAATNNYRMRLKADNCDLVNLEVRAYSDDAGTIARDLPSRITIHSTGSAGRANQTLQAQIPRLAPLSGIWDYVIFSEQAIVK